MLKVPDFVAFGARSSRTEENGFLCFLVHIDILDDGEPVLTGLNGNVHMEHPGVDAVELPRLLDTFVRLIVLHPSFGLRNRVEGSRPLHHNSTHLIHNNGLVKTTVVLSDGFLLKPCEVCLLSIATLEEIRVHLILPVPPTENVVHDPEHLSKQWVVGPCLYILRPLQAVQGINQLRTHSLFGERH